MLSTNEEGILSVVELIYTGITFFKIRTSDSHTTTWNLGSTGYDPTRGWHLAGACRTYPSIQGDNPCRTSMGFDASRVLGILARSALQIKYMNPDFRFEGLKLIYIPPAVPNACSGSESCRVYTNHITILPRQYAACLRFIQM